MFVRIGLLIGCGALLFLSWTAVLNIESPMDKQTTLVSQAHAEIDNGTRANAQPLLEQAAAYNTPLTFDVQEQLKEVYKELGETAAYAKLLKRQVADTNSPASVYLEAAEYYLTATGKLSDVLDVLKTGIRQTGDSSLIDFYEKHRYAFSIGRESYQNVTEYLNGGIQVQRDGLWGLANASGVLILPCAYEQISTYDTSNQGRVAAVQNGDLVMLNLKSQAVAKYNGAFKRIGSFSEGLLTLQTANDKWIFADSKLLTGEAEYDDIGASGNAAIALKPNGSKWGVSAMDGDVIVPYEYDDIIRDELGRCYAQDAVFAVSGGKARLFVDGVDTGKAYEDARPFTNDGWAAVKQNGKWGFIDNSGTFRIEPQFEDALSFSGHLAAVKQGELWGYLALTGKIAIEPQFLQAKSFSGGNAPVLTDHGWQFILLEEYKKGTGI
jgi:hypothetical protein